MNFNILSHAGEAHETAVQATSHATLSNWYIALPLFLISIALFTYIVWKISKKNLLTTLLATSIALLATGFGFAQTIPSISVIAITAGLIIAGFLAFTSLSAPEK